MRGRQAAAAAMTALFLAILAAMMAAQQPPALHSIEGTIYNTSGPPDGQTYLGTSFSINDSGSGDYIKSLTNVPVPGLSGRYAETINGTDGDLVIVHAWNLTHYGTTNRTLLGDMSGVDVYLNHTRPSEANVTIQLPANSTLFTEGDYINITVNVSMLGDRKSVV